VKNQHRSRKIYVFVPCHNRREQTTQTVSGIIKQLDALPNKYEIHVLDDGSCDGTSSKILSVNSLVRIHRLSGNELWGGSLNYIIDYCKNVLCPIDNNGAVLITNDDLYLEKSSLLKEGFKLMAETKDCIIAPVVVDLNQDEWPETVLEKDRQFRDSSIVNYGHYFDEKTNGFYPLKKPGVSNLGVTVATWFPICCFKSLDLIPKSIPHYGSDYWLTKALSNMNFQTITDLRYIICRSKKDTFSSKRRTSTRIRYWYSCCNPKSPDYLLSSVVFLKEFSSSKNKIWVLTFLKIKFLVFRVFFGKNILN